MAWEDTGVDAGAEVEAAKVAALSAFMAAPVDSAIGSGPAVPPQISRTVWTQSTKLSDGDVVKLKKVVNAAIMDATLKHIGPVSSDGSVAIDISEVGGIKKLNLRASSVSWEHITIDPSAVGLARDIFTIVWQDNTETPAKPIGLWVKINTADTAWSKIWPISVPSQPLKSELLPLPDGVAALGNEGRWADGQHVHPKERPAKIRYYLSDTQGLPGGDPEWTGLLLLTENPYDEANAIDYVDDSEWAVFVSSPGSPGLATWQGGVVHAHLRVKLINPQVGRTYRLYTGNGDIVYTAMIWDWTHGNTYQVKESAPTQPEVTEIYTTLDFDVPVTSLAAGTDGRLGLNMRLRVYVGDDEAVFSNEKIVIRIGGNDASYLDTLFTPDGGFSGVHNDLDGREAANCHPQSAITPGRIHTPLGATVATSAGLFTVPANSNLVVLSGTEDILGCSTEGFTAGDYMEFMVLSGRKILRSQTVEAGYANFIWGSMDTGYGSDYNEIAALADSVYRCRLIGGVWRLCSLMNV